MEAMPFCIIDKTFAAVSQPSSGQFSESPLRHAQVLAEHFALSSQTSSPRPGENMKTLSKLAGVLALTLVLGLSAYAGQTDTPPCGSPEPGQTDTPPCQITPPGDTGGPSNSPTATAADEAFTEIMTEVLESMLSIF
jgi:hypothetical protein